MLTIDLSGRTAVVTGGASGIGRATAKLLAQAGAAVAILDRNYPYANNVVDEIVGADARAAATAYRCDVDLSSEVGRTIRAIVESHGGIDILVNAAGIWVGGPLTTTTVTDAQVAIGVNQMGPLIVTSAAWPYLAEADNGVVVNIGSVQAHGIYVEPSTYNMTKAAVEALTLGLAVQGGPLGIRAVCVAPGPIANTGMSGAPPAAIDALRRSVPVGRRGTPEEVAFAVLMACAPQSSYLSGTTITVDGGLSAERRPVTLLPARPRAAGDPDA